MAVKPNPVASTTPVEGRPGMVQDWDKNGNPYGQPRNNSSNVDPGFSAPTTSKPGQIAQGPNSKPVNTTGKTVLHPDNKSPIAGAQYPEKKKK